MQFIQPLKTSLLTKLHFKPTVSGRKHSRVGHYKQSTNWRIIKTQGGDLDSQASRLAVAAIRDIEWTNDNRVAILTHRHSQALSQRNGIQRWAWEGDFCLETRMGSTSTGE